MHKYNVQSMINIGTEICFMIKNIYFKEVQWTPKLSNEINKMFFIIKEKSKIFYPDLSAEELLKMIRKYSTEDFNDCLENYFTKMDKIYE